MLCLMRRQALEPQAEGVGFRAWRADGFESEGFSTIEGLGLGFRVEGLGFGAWGARV